MESSLPQFPADPESISRRLFADFASTAGTSIAIAAAFIYLTHLFAVRYGAVSFGFHIMFP